jgi:hypothetical protein
MFRAEPVATRRTSRRRRLPLLTILVALLAVLTTAGVAGATAVTQGTATHTATGAGAATTTDASSSTLSPDAVPAGPAPKGGSVSAYWLVGADGGVFAFGGAPYYGSMGGTRLNRPVVGLAPTAPLNWGGYREVATDGGVFAFGNALFYGSMGGSPLNAPIVGIVGTPDGNGYWMVASDGGIFAFGDAAFYGSMGGTRLNQPVVGMAATSDGRGYWLVGADGGVFNFGDAGFVGSTGNIHLVSPIVSITGTHTGQGYLLTAADGGVFAFGDARYFGSLGATPKIRPIASLAKTLDGGGYWMVNTNGAVTAFGDATYWGSTPQVLAAPIVEIVMAPGTGAFTGSDYPSGSYGYDISNWQCGNYPPAPHTVSVVQVVGASFGGTNPCLSGEAAWAGGGLNLYMYLTYGTAASSSDGACASTGDTAACNFGFNAALDAFVKAQAAGVDASVPWWLDLEDSSFQGHPVASAAMVQGAIDGFHAEGINSVGIYASPGNWNSMVGSYRPAVAYWAADWGPASSTTCASVHQWYPGLLPTGPVVMVQYGVGTWDEDYAC